MKLKSLSAAIALGCAVASGSVSAVVVGGVDFGIIGEPPISQHIETTTLAETVVLADGDVLQGYGVVNTVNGNNEYAAGGQKLFFVFNNYVTQNFTPTSTEFTGGVVDIYLGANTNLLNQDSNANLAYITGLTPWVRFTGHGNLGGGAAANATITADGTLTGASLAFTGQGLLDVDLTGAFGIAAVANFLDGNNEVDAVGGLADVVLTTSGSTATPNPFDVINGLCGNGPGGAPAAGDWCIQGSADLRGSTVPAPAGLALLGAGLLGFAGMGRRKKA